MLQVSAHIDALSGRGDQNNVFRLLGPHTSRVVLSTANDFRGSLALAAPTPSSALPPPHATSSGALVPATSITLFVGLASAVALMRARSRRKSHAM